MNVKRGGLNNGKIRKGEYSMISIGLAFLMFVVIFILIVGCAFGGLWLGALIHHRGVKIGSGSNQNFSGKIPDGEVFRLPGVDELPTEPEGHDLNENEEQRSIRERGMKFLSAHGLDSLLNK